MVHRRGPGSAFTCLLLVCLTAALGAEAATVERLPARLAFEANRGQAPLEVRYLARGRRYQVALTSVGAEVRFDRKGGAEKLRMRFVDAAGAAVLTGQGEASGRVHYYLGRDPSKWITDVPVYERVAARDIYPGIDLVYYGDTAGRLEYDLVVAAGAAASRIGVVFEHCAAGSETWRATRARLDARGDLVAAAAGGAVVLRAPVVYQDAGGERRAVKASYRVAPDGAVSVALGDYDATRPLVIDPVLVYSTYIGGEPADYLFGLAVDGGGNTFFTGFFGSGADSTAYVAKLDAAGTSLQFATLFGGDDFDGGGEIALDPQGNVWVTGNTGSVNFPGPGHPASQFGYGGGRLDAFVAKFDSTGKMLFSLLLGGGDDDLGLGVATDAEGNAWVVGETNSGEVVTPTATRTPTVNPPQDTPTRTPTGIVDRDGFPVTGNAIQRSRQGGSDAFVSKISPAGSLVYSTYLGGSGVDNAAAVAVDTAGNAYVTGDTSSPGGEEGAIKFPVGPGVQLTHGGGSNDVFLTKLSPAGSIVYSTFFGGEDSDRGFAIAVDAAFQAHVLGRSNSTNLPTTFMAYQTGVRENVDAFVAKFDATGTQTLYATFLGGDGVDIGRGIDVDAAGLIYVAGATTSTDFPVRDAIQSADGVGCTPASCPGRAVWVSFVNPAGHGHEDLVFSTYLGGNGDESGEALALGPDNLVYIGGYTTSNDFPEAGFPLQDALVPPQDCFISKIRPDPPDSMTPPTSTRTRTQTQTPSRTSTATITSTITSTRTPSRTHTPTVTGTRTSTPTESVTRTRTATQTRTRTPTPSSTGTNTPTPSPTGTPTPACGDRHVDAEPPFFEDCDDGNNMDGDGCPANCKFGIVLSPRLVFGLGLCETSPRPIEVREIVSGDDITRNADVEYEWIKEEGLPRDLADAVINELKERSDGTIDVSIAPIKVEDGHVVFTSPGVNVLRAKRNRTGAPPLYSNYAFLIGGMKLFEAGNEGNLKIAPVSLATTFVPRSVADSITRILGEDFKDDAPMFLFTEGPFCNGTAEFLGNKGVLTVESLTFDFFGGKVKDFDFVAAIGKLVGLLPTKGPIGWIAAAIDKGKTLLAAQLLDFEVTLEAEGNSEKMGGKKETEDAVIRVFDDVTTEFPFFKGTVMAKGPGISAVQATFDMDDYCLGKASDMTLVLVAPKLERTQIRNEMGVVEDPLQVKVQGERTAHAVAMFNFFSQTSPAVPLPFDPISKVRDRLENTKKQIEGVLPGVAKMIDDFEVPFTATLPIGKDLVGGFYVEGDRFFRTTIKWQVLPATFTVEELRIQVPLPDLVTKWTMLSPPPPPPAATVDPSAGVVSGVHRGTGVLQLDACVPFITGDFDPFDINGVRVLGEDMPVEGTKFDDVDGSGVKDAFEPGLGGWTIEAVTIFGAPVASAITGSDGHYSFVVRREDLPPGLNTFTVREVQQSGWTTVFPSGGRIEGIPFMPNVIAEVNFANFRDVTVRGHKFEDQNGSAVQDAGEPSLPGWTIELVDSRGAVRRAVTDGEGAYAFQVGYDAFQGSGTTRVRELLQDGWTQVFPFAGGAQAIVKAGVPLRSGVTYEVNFANRAFTPTPTITPTFTPSPTVTDTRTFTPTETGTPEPTDTSTATPTGEPVSVIGGHKYEDLNANGQRDAGEPPLRDWVIFLDDDGDDILDNRVRGDGICDPQAAETCIHTDAGGEYGFPTTDPGVFTVREVQQEGWVQTSANPPDLGITEVGVISYGNIDFGNFHLGTVSGNIFADAAGGNAAAGAARGGAAAGGALAGWSVFADTNLDGLPSRGEPQATSAADGSYVLEGLGFGSHVIRERERCGFQQTSPPAPAGLVLSIDHSGATGEGVDFGLQAPEGLPGDVNGDGHLSAADLPALIAVLGGAPAPPEADVDLDGRIGAADLPALHQLIFECGDLTIVPPARTATPTRTPTPLPTSSGTVTPTRTLTPTPPFTATAELTATRTPSPATPVATATSTTPPTATPTGLSTSTRTRTPTGPTPSATSSPTTVAADDVGLAGGAPSIANAVAALPSLITAIVSGFEFGGAALFADGDGGAAGSCPLGGQAVRVCSGNVHVTITLTACALPTTTGSVVVDGTVTLDGAGFCPSIILPPYAAVADVQAVFRDTQLQVKQTARAMVSGTVNPTLGGSCTVSGAALVLSGTLSTEFAGSAGVALGLTSTNIGVTDITFGSGCVPQAYTLTFNGPGTVTQSAGGTSGGAAASDAIALVFSTFVVRTDGGVTPAQTRLDGGLTSECYGGMASLTTIDPLAQPLGEPCPTAGKLRVMRPGQTLQVLYLGGGLVGVDRDLDGNAEENYLSCLEPVLLACAALNLPTPTRTQTPSVTATEPFTPTEPSTPTEPPTAVPATVTPPPGATSTATPVSPPTATSTRTPSRTPSVTPIPTRTASPTASLTPTVPPAPTSTASGTVTRTATPTPSATATPAGAFLFCDALPSPVLIPDGDTTGISNAFAISAARTIGDLNVRLEIEHEFVGDLRVRLTHVETGTTVTLIDRPGVPATMFGCGGADIACTLDDQASRLVEDECGEDTPSIASRLRPNAALSAFAGEGLSGTWSLNVADMDALISGSLVHWCLEANVHAPVITAFTCDGEESCLLGLGEPFELDFSWTDADANASAWRVHAIGDGFEFDAGSGAIAPPSAAGSIVLNGAPFTCSQPPCADTPLEYVLTLSDTTGLDSEPRSVFLLVTGTP